MSRFWSIWLQAQKSFVPIASFQLLTMLINFWLLFTSSGVLRHRIRFDLSASATNRLIRPPSIEDQIYLLKNWVVIIYKIMQTIFNLPWDVKENCLEDQNQAYPRVILVMPAIFFIRITFHMLSLARLAKNVIFLQMTSVSSCCPAIIVDHVLREVELAIVTINWITWRFCYNLAHLLYILL